MKRIRLYGHLRKFGKEFLLDIATPAEAIRALCIQVPDFEAHLRKHSEPGYRIRVGKECLGEDALALPFGSEVIRIVPVVAGASGSGLGQILVGIVLIAASFIPGLNVAVAGYMMSAGVAMTIGGAAQMLAGNPAYSPANLDRGPADTPTYAFQGGPHQTVGQGNPVPWGFGRVRIGGALVSVGISPETWPTNGFGGKAPDQIGTMGGDGDVNPWVWAIAPST